MDKRFSSCEIVEMSIQIEKNGKDFYSAIAGKTEEPEVKKVFTYLAGEEEKHIEVFKGIFASTCDLSPEGAFPEDYFAYMNALAGQYVFTKKNKGAELAGSVGSRDEGIDVGITFEKDSILFFEEVKKAVPEKDRAAIDLLIEEEKKHLKQLLDLKSGQ